MTATLGKKKCMIHLSVFLILTMNNLLLTIGIGGKQGANSTSAELLLHTNTWFTARTMTKTIKANARNKKQKKKKRMVDIDYSGELLSQEMLFYTHLCILNTKIYWIFQFSRSHRGGQDFFFFGIQIIYICIKWTQDVTDMRPKLWQHRKVAL